MKIKNDNLNPFSLFHESKFTDFVFLGDLSKIPLNEMKNKLNNKFTVQIDFFENYQSVNWKNDQVSITIFYKLNGEFLKISEEIWFK